MGKFKCKTPKVVAEKKSQFNEWKNNELYDVTLQLQGKFKMTDTNTIQLACKGEHVNMPDKKGELTDCTLFVVKEDGNKQEIKLDANILGMLKMKEEKSNAPAPVHPIIDPLKKDDVVIKNDDDSDDSEDDSI